MENTTRERNQVALLIDFENLIYGLIGEHGTAYEEKVDPEILMRVSEEYGQVVLANAYADWRGREVNQFQVDLYRLGIDLVHVLGKRYGTTTKNAVDVKMAVDAVEIMWKYAHIDTFVIVSGDRDFIHVLKTLRRNGKRIIGISPSSSTSADFAELCDRFIKYESLRNTLVAAEAPAPASGTPATTPGIQRIKEVLSNALAARPSGIKGAQVKPLLRRMISPTFDESEYGFSRLSDMLYTLTDIMDVVASENGGDLTLFPKGVATNNALEGPSAISASVPAPSLQRFKLNAHLTDYRFESEIIRRTELLQTIFNVMQEQRTFSTNSITKQLQSFDVSLSTAIIGKYMNVLYQSKAFIVGKDEKEKQVWDKVVELSPEIKKFEDVVERYESGIVAKVIVAAGKDAEMVDAVMVSTLLGLPSDGSALGYAEKVLKRARTLIKVPVNTEKAS